MILPGTLVQLVRPDVGVPLREAGIFTVTSSEATPERAACSVHGHSRDLCTRTSIRLAEALYPEGDIACGHDGAPKKLVSGFSLCRFRIIAPPITEADRLEASAPDAPAKPKRVRA